VSMATTSAPVTDDLARTREEERLARRAAEGDGAAFATLYDRYERRIFNYCLRLLASSDDAADATQDAFLKVLQRLPKLGDRELNFSAYLYTAARNASYDMIGRRKKTEPVDEIGELAGVGGREPGAIDEDPERAVLLDSFQADVQDANARLPERQREVLVMREVDELSYDEIAEIMDMNRNSVAQLISRARIKLRDELRGTALASISAVSAECERALPLISMRQDSQLKKPEDRAWLEAHLASCETCKVSVEAMEEAGVSYRAWLPIVPLEFLRQATIAKAAELVGADWSELAEAGRSGDPGASAPDGGAHPEAGASSGGAGSTGLLHLPASWLRGNGAHAAGDDSSRRRRRGLVVGVLAALLLLLGAAAVVVGSDDTPPAGEPGTGENAGAQGGAGGTGDGSQGGGADGASTPGTKGPGGKDGSVSPNDGLTDVPFLPGIKIKPDGTTVVTGTPGKPTKTRGGKTPSSDDNASTNSGGGSKKPGKKPSRTPSRTPSGNGGGGTTNTPSGSGGNTSTPPSASDPTPPGSDPPASDPPASDPPASDPPAQTPSDPGGSTNRPAPTNPTTPSTPTRVPSRTPPSTGGGTTTTPCRTPTGARC
jgi:RNA polymerase sigma factor (sigma-70 family)